MDAIASMHDLARTAMGQMPPPHRFQDDDAAIIRDARDLLLSYEAEFVRGFFEVVYAHPATAAAFGHVERSQREAGLSEWWRRTANGPLNEQYFAWMAMRGLQNVVHEITNPMTLAMTSHVAGFVAGKIGASGMDRREARNLIEAFRRLMITVGAVVTSGYEQALFSALHTVTGGMPEALLRRLRDEEVQAALMTAREELGRR